MSVRFPQSAMPAKVAPAFQLGRAWLALLLALVLAGVLAAGMLLTGSRWLPDGWQIRWLQVDGNFRRVSAEQVRAAVAPHAGGGFFEVDPEAVRMAAERLPWVTRAMVRKQWPDTIRVRVLEHEPMARWGDGALVSTEGELFEVPEGPRIQGLPVLAGPAGSVREVVERFFEWRELLQGTGLDIRQLSVDERGAWRTQLSYGISVALGTERVSERLGRFAAVYPEHFAARGRQLQQVDLRYTNGFAIRWRDDARDGTNDTENEKAG